MVNNKECKYMKKMFLVLMALVTMSTGLFAEEKEYIYEEGFVSYETLDEVIDMMLDASEPVSFSDFAEIRDYLYASTEDEYCVFRDVTFEELKDLLIPVSYSKSSKILESTKDYGFSVNAFYYDDVVLWICIVEKDFLYKIGD